jgi:hypothetical protein
MLNLKVDYLFSKKITIGSLKHLKVKLPTHFISNADVSNFHAIGSTLGVRVFKITGTHSRG